MRRYNSELLMVGNQKRVEKQGGMFECVMQGRGGGS